MKTLFHILAILFFATIIANAQVPQAVPYQGIARDNAGNLISNQNISVRFSILDSIPTGTLLFQETHSATTNIHGLFTLNIGQGNVVSGSFPAIDWGKNLKFLRVDLDAAGGSNYTTMGTSQLLSVPYSLYSLKSLLIDSNSFSGILYDKDLMIISTHTNDTVFRVDTLGVSRHKGKEFFFRGIWIFDTLVVVDTLGKPVFQVNPDGTSYHKGKERFEGGIVVGDSTGAIARINPDGSIEIADTTGKVLFRVNPDGTSYHAGMETFEGGVTVGDSTGSILRINPDGTIEVTDTLGNTLFKLNPDGTSLHAGRETYEGGISVGLPLGTKLHVNPDGSIEMIDGAGNLVFRIGPDGTSYHAGHETFEGGITVGDSSGSFVRIKPDGTIVMYDSTGFPVLLINPDGSSIHAGHEIFQGGISVIDSNEAITFRVFPDGTSYHAGNETFAGGIQVVDSNGTTTMRVTPNGETIIGDSSKACVRIGPNGSIAVLDSSGNIVFYVDSSGSYHDVVEIFSRGIIVGDNPLSSSLEIGPDGSISLYNFLGVLVYSLNPDGTSYHARQEHFEGGILVGNANGPHAEIDEDGSITIRDANGNIVFGVDENGNSIHLGKEVFLDTVEVIGPGIFLGNGSGINTIDAGSVSLGTLDDARLSPNVALKNTMNVFTESQTINASGGTALTCTAPLTGTAGQFNGNVSVNGSFVGNAFTSFSPNGNAGEFNGRLVVNAVPGSADAIIQSNNFGGIAGEFNGDVFVNGNVAVSGSVIKGGGTFRIDHPLDPENKYLNHSFVESDEMMNIYNGNCILDQQGGAVITLPSWFGALNKDFRYQLTAIGSPGPDLYIAEEVSNNTFKIAGGKKGMKVSWQVTGVRKDPYADKHRVIVEEDKPVEKRGTYLHPEVYIQE